MTRVDKDLVPVADAVEQTLAVDPADETTEEPPGTVPGVEVNEADAVEQATPVPQSDDDYR